MDANFRKVITASACAFNIGMLSWWAQPIIVHSVIRGLSLSEPEAGMLISVEIMAIALTSLTISPRIHRFRIRLTCFSGCLAAITCHLLSVFIDTYTVLLAVRMCAGVAEGLVYSIAVGVVASTINPSRGYGIINAVNIVYCSIFMAVVPSIELSVPNVVVFASLAAGSLIMAPFVYSLPASVTVSEEGASVPAGGFDTRAWLLLIAMFLWGTGINSLWPYLFYIGTRTALEVREVGVVLGISGLAAFAGVMLMTVIGHRFGYLRPLLPALLVNLAAVLSITLTPLATAYIISLVILMMAVYFIFPFLLAISAGLDPAGRVAAATGGIYMFTGGIGPVIGGNLVAAIGAEGIGYVFIGECLLTMYLIWRVVTPSD